MKLIVGLGNPGAKYESTRHNLGFMVVDQFLKDFEAANNTNWEDNKKFKATIAQFTWEPKNGNEEKIVIAKPNTFMNNSGIAVQLLADYFHMLPEDIWVCHDEIDLPSGMLKIRFGGGAAGHHGVESIMNTIGTDKFWRFRLGIGITHKFSENAAEEGTRKPIGKEKMKHVEEFVVNSFGEHEQGKIRELIKRATKALEMALQQDLTTAMNRYNTK